MRVYLRLRLSPAMHRRFVRMRELSSAMAALLTPAAAMSFVLGAWRLCSDLKWTGDFVISEGIFSHWQVWMAMAGVLQTCAAILNRFGRGGGDEAVS